MGKTKEPEVGPCCFCGQEISENKADPCKVTIQTKHGHSQVWFCHGACFRRKIVGDPALEPAHF